MYASTIGSVWDQAAKNLTEASRIVIIGYSFPRTDTKALTLLKDSLSTRPGEISVELVAPDATAIVSRLDKAVLSLAKSFIPRDLTFEKYLEDIDTQIPSMMRTAASQDAEVRQWIQTMMGLSSTTKKQRAALHRGSGGTRNEP